MGLDYKSGIIFMLGSIATHYIDNFLNNLDPFLKQKVFNIELFDLILLIVFSVGILIIIIDIINRIRHKIKQEKALEIEQPISNNKNEISSLSITKKLGSPRIDEGIQKYENRDDLPKLNQLIANATKTVDMSALSYYLMILDHSNVIKKALKKGIKFTLLILDANSKEVEKYSQTLENGKYLKQHINSTLEILCELKKELNKDNLTIKTYDSFQKHNIIIIDKDTENALVKVEYYNFDNPKTRPNKITYKVDNPDFYESSLMDYNELLEKSKDYVC